MATIRQRKILPLIIIAAVSAMMWSCSSSRHTTSRPATARPSKEQPTHVRCPAADNNPAIDELISEAKKWIGAKYRYGGHSRKDGTDCSGMVMELFLKVFDIKLPRNSAQQQEFCSSIRQKDLQAGDLMFFATGKNRNRVSHVGLYIGGDEMIHASSSRGVIISNINEQYYARNYHSSGRVIDRPTKRPKTSKNDRPLFRLEIPPVSSSDSLPSDPAGLDDAINAKIDSIYSSMME